MKTLATIVLLSSWAWTAQTDILRVRADALPGGDGSSWLNAINDLQLAISAAISGDEIWVARGVYKPTTTNVRTISFGLKGGVGIYGGFGGTETQRNQRNSDPRENGTILSGDIDGNDVNTDGNLVTEDAAQIQGLNSFHVVTVSNKSSVILDGLTITGGQANGTGRDSEGGGVRCNNFGGVRFASLIVSGNAGQVGAALYCTLGDFILTRSTLVGNSAGSRGGGVCMIDADGFVTQVRVSGNHAAADGGGVYYDGGDVVFTQVLFTGNTAGTSGGGMHVDDDHPFMVQTVFAGNRAGLMGAAIGGFSTAFVQNSIIWSNSPLNPMDAISLIASHCVIEGGHPAGMNIITNDPLFVRLPDPDNDDFGDLRLLLGSPAINAGNNDFVPMDDADLDGDGLTAEQLPMDLAGRPRILNGTVDIGAFEGGYATFSRLYPNLRRELDANANGFSNIGEYAFVTDPTAPGNLPNRPRMIRTNDTLLLEYTQRANAADLDLVLRRSPDLRDWMVAQEGKDYATISSALSGQNADMLNFVVRIFNDAPSEFWRIDIHSTD